MSSFASPKGPRSSANARAFTLMEVMIAMGIFFLAVFAILGVVSTNLRNARLLQKMPVDAGMLVSQLSLTNQLTEGSDSGDFGDLYPGFKWTSEITAITNGLFQVEYLITAPAVRGETPAQTHMTVLLWRPMSAATTPTGPVPRLQ